MPSSKLLMPQQLETINQFVNMRSLEQKTVPSPSTPAPVKKTNTDRWQECNVNLLAEPFHRYDSETLQHNRISTLLLTEDMLDNLFPANKTITSFDILFGIKEDSSNKQMFSFTAEIVVQGSGYLNSMEFQDSALIGVGEIASETIEVPHEFKEWLSKNWLELDVSLIDDVFVACSTPANLLIKPTQRPLHRLRGYHFTPQINASFLEFILGHLDVMVSFYLHLGVDMNKFNHKEEFAFSPIFEIRYTNLTDSDIIDLHRRGVKSSRVTITNNSGETQTVDAAYFEYSSPCPSSCATA